MEVNEKEFYRRMGVKRTENPEDGKEIEIVKEVELVEEPRYNSEDTAGIIEKIGKTLKEVCTFSSQNVETDGVYITRIFNGGNAKVEIYYPIYDDVMLKRSFKLKYPEGLAGEFQKLFEDLQEWKDPQFQKLKEKREQEANKAKTEKEIEKAYNEKLKAAATEKYKSMSDAEKAALHEELKNSGKKSDDFDKYSIWEIAKDLEKEARKISSYSPDAPDYEKVLKDASDAGYKIKINHKYFDLK